MVVTGSTGAGAVSTLELPWTADVGEADASGFVGAERGSPGSGVATPVAGSI